MHELPRVTLVHGALKSVFNRTQTTGVTMATSGENLHVSPLDTEGFMSKNTENADFLERKVPEEEEEEMVNMSE